MSSLKLAFVFLSPHRQCSACPYINTSQESAELSVDTQQLNMLLSNQVALVRMLLNLCIINVRSIVSEVMRRLFSFWMTENKAQVSIQPKRTNLSSTDEVPTPRSVNYHFTRQCNYKCGFCFHTAKTSFVLPIEEAKKGLRLLKEAGK